jgi:hypothetical protein
LSTKKKIPLIYHSTPLSLVTQRQKSAIAGTKRSAVEANAAFVIEVVSNDISLKIT